HSRTRTPSAHDNPLTHDENRVRTVVDNVRKRDNFYRCRRTAWMMLGTHPVQAETIPVMYKAPLEVLHGFPYGVGANVSPGTILAITGVSFENSVADHESNALPLHIILHALFTNFQIYFELNANNELVLCYRTQPPQADPTGSFLGVGSPRRNLQSLLVLDGDTLRPVPATQIAEPDPKFFFLHKALGDVFWMLQAEGQEL
ncbi:hypothetical protein C8J57DRAFT_1354191, partial [Mycena rebaudengoi]